MIKHYSAVVLRRREDIQQSLLDVPLSAFEAFLSTQAYGGLSLERAKDVQFTMVIHNGQVNFLRRVLDVEDLSGIDHWESGVHFITTHPGIRPLMAIEGTPYTRNLRRAKYVTLCWDTETDEVWLEDKGGKIS